MRTKKEATNMGKTVNKEKYRVTYTTVDGKERELIWEIEFGRKDPVKVMEAINTFVETGEWPSAREKQRAYLCYIEVVSEIRSRISIECYNDEKLRKELYKQANVKAKQMDEELEKYYTKKNQPILAEGYKFENRDYLKREKRSIRYYRNKYNYIYRYYLYTGIIARFQLYSVLSIERYEE